MKEKIKIPEWLKNLQENSWELELLISGGAVFTLLQASDFLINSMLYMKMTTAAPLNTIMISGMFGLKLLTFGFIFHLLLRTFWVAMVFINFVFPGGINENKVKFKKPFRENIDEDSTLYKSIMNVDKLSGIVIFLSIIYTIVISGLIISLIVFLPMSTVLDNYFNISFVRSVFVYSFLIYVFDLVSFGLLRKIKFLSYILYPFFWVYDYVSLRFLYKKSLMVYSTNIPKLKAVFFTLVFLIIVLFSTYLTLQKRMGWPNIFDRREYRFQLAYNYNLWSNYEDEKLSSRITIPSKIIKDNFLELKVDYYASQDIFIDLLDKEDNEKLFSDVIEVSIDDSIYSKVEWFPYRNMSKNIWGVKAMLPIYDLKKGKHLLIVQYKSKIKEKAKKIGWNIDKHVMVIPFWKNND